MQIKFAVLAAALSTGVVSDFLVVSVPTPNLTDLNNIQSRIASLTQAFASQVAQLTASVGASEISRARSAQTALASFVATAPSSLSIPSKITEVGNLQTFTSVPGWYSALPSDLKSYYDSQNAKAQSVANALVGVTPTGSAATGSTATGAQTSKTGAAVQDKVVQYAGMGIAAAFAGVFAL